MSVVLYSTHCPRCLVLEKKLDEANIEYTLVEDACVMLDKGFSQAPVLEVDGEALDFGQAIKRINENTL